MRDTYAFVESLPTHHAYLVRWDGEPVVLVQAYSPEHDPVATAYDPQPGDLGLHFFLGSRGPTARHGSPDDPWTVLGPAMREFLFAGPGTRRVVGEPGANNHKAIDRMITMGFTAGERVSFQSPQGPKEARTAYLTRELTHLDRVPVDADLAAEQLTTPVTELEKLEGCVTRLSVRVR